MAMAMTISGINLNAYYINNPIWVDITNISNATKYVTVKVSDPANPSLFFSFDLYPNSGKTYFDLADVVKGHMKEPKHPQWVINGGLIRTNYIKLLLEFFQINQSGQITEARTFTKDFVRGGLESQRSNVGFRYPTNVPKGAIVTVLKESELLPVWQGYPRAKYALLNTGQIAAFTVIPNNEVERRKVVVCNPIYLRFKNTKGGYSFWLFEKWEMEKKAEKTEYIERRRDSGNTGHKVEYKLTVTGRVERRYFRTIRALIQSSEVHAYGLTNLALNDTGSTLNNTVSTLNNTVSTLNHIGSLWDRVINQGDSVSTNNFEEMKEFTISFDYISTQKPTIKW